MKGISNGTHEGKGNKRSLNEERFDLGLLLLRVIINCSLLESSLLTTDSESLMQLLQLVQRNSFKRHR